jgi:inosine-uridine nucleoside N-ribohydrolase
MTPVSEAGLWIDTDNALGAARGNVDDGLAIAAALGSEARMLGISCGSGNTDAGTALRVTRELLGRLPSEQTSGLPLLPAADAARSIAALPAGASLLALGPLTHVAAAARLDPTLPARCTLRVVTTVGAPWRAPLLALRDRNRRADPEAARTVLALPWRRLLVFPLDVVRRFRLGADDLARLEREAGELGAWLASGAERWRRQQRWRRPGGRFRVSDVVAALDTVGELPGARFAAGRLVAFDAEAARQRFHALIVATATR